MGGQPPRRPFLCTSYKGTLILFSVFFSATGGCGLAVAAAVVVVAAAVAVAAFPSFPRRLAGPPRLGSGRAVLFNGGKDEFSDDPSSTVLTGDDGTAHLLCL